MASIMITEPAGYDLLKKLFLRMTWFDNYNIFYYYDKNTEIIHIIRILYNRADWQNILKR